MSAIKRRHVEWSASRKTAFPERELLSLGFRLYDPIALIRHPTVLDMSLPCLAGRDVLLGQEAWRAATAREG